MKEVSKTTEETAKILIADDVDKNRFILRDIILEMGFVPILTANGAQALKMMERVRPDLIVLDVAMPEMDGHEFCRIIKENPDTRDIPVIFISAFDDPSDIVEGFALGGEDYITKPFIPEVVKARLALHLKLHYASLQLRNANRLLKSSVSEQLGQLELEKKNILFALSRVIKELPGYDEAFTKRLGYNCRTLAEAMQLSDSFGHLISDSFLDAVEIAVTLRDLGNVAMPTGLLTKKSPLSPEETALLHRHADIGSKILKDIQTFGDYNDFLTASVEIARGHHERWDGTGYPDQKRGDEIPLSAQIAAVAGAYCEMTWPQAGAAQAEQALRRLEEESGKKFHPDIVMILKRVYRQMR